MNQINLLPWRLQKRQRDKNKIIFAALASIIFACFIVLVVNFYFIFLKSKQFARNQLLKEEIVRLDGIIKKFQTMKQKRFELIRKLKLLQTLQSNRLFMVHLFSELFKITPNGVYITRLERQNNKIALWGYSDSNTKISYLLKNMENNDWIQDANLSEIKKMKAKKMSFWNAFNINFTFLTKPTAFQEAI